METLQLLSPDFEEGGWIPKKNSGYGEDLSPRFEVRGIAPGAVSMAMTLEDASHPIWPNFCHWVVWDLPVLETLPGGIPRGGRVDGLGGAGQGVAYGRNRYRGPKPPLRWCHDYVFTLYVLDRMCALPPKSRRADLLACMEGHILQRAVLTGKFQNHRREQGGA